MRTLFLLFPLVYPTPYHSQIGPVIIPDRSAIIRAQEQPRMLDPLTTTAPGPSYLSPALIQNRLNIEEENVAMQNASAPATSSAQLVYDGSISHYYGHINGLDIKVTAPDQSALLAVNKGHATINAAKLVKQGASSSPEQTESSGLNAAVRCLESELTLRNTAITTQAALAPALYISGDQGRLSTNYCYIECKDQQSAAAIVTQGAKLTMSLTHLSTVLEESPGIEVSEDGELTLFNSTVSTQGTNSAALILGGAAQLDHSQLESRQSSALIIEAEKKINASNSLFKGQGYATILLRSTADDGPEGNPIILQLSDSHIHTQDGASIMVTNTAAQINLDGVSAQNNQEALISVRGFLWGSAGQNGGKLHLHVTDSRLSGIIRVDALSSATIELDRQTQFTGTIQSQSPRCSLWLSRGISWRMTGDAYVGYINSQTAPIFSILKSIQSQGYHIYYRPELNAHLRSQIYPLPGGGFLRPSSPMDTGMYGSGYLP